RHQADLARLARLEADGGAGGNIEPHAAGFRTLELQGVVGLKKMVVRADLDRPVPGVGHFERELRCTGIELDVARSSDDFAWDHVLTGSAGGRSRASCRRER